MTKRVWQDAGSLNPEWIVGKTIEGLPLVSDSWLEIRFTDGSELHLTGDAGGYQQFVYIPASAHLTEEER